MARSGAGTGVGRLGIGLATFALVTVAPAGSASAISQREILDDVDTAEAAVDDFWDDHWSDFFTGRYTAPNVVGIYDGRDPDSAPTCGGQPLVPDNAVYCPFGDYVAYDVSLLGRSETLGDAFLYLVVAHEWGHAIQARLDGSLVATRVELQADCLAGAAIYGAAADGSLQFEPEDAQELADSLAAIADETPWTDVSDHGNAAERIGAFERGRDTGVPGCLPTAG